MGKAILIFLLPALIATLGIIIINNSKTPEVEHKSAAYGPGTGYSQVPEEYIVTASTHYKWHHGTCVVWLAVVGFIVFAAGGGYVYWVDKEVKNGTLLVIAIFWILGFACIFAKHIGRYYERGTFERTISAEQYEANKDNLDAIFLQ
jgi:uncharacterized membrane protein YfcA